MKKKWGSSRWGWCTRRRRGIRGRHPDLQLTDVSRNRAAGAQKNRRQENTAQRNYIHRVVQADAAEVLVQAGGAGFGHGEVRKVIAEPSRHNRPEAAAEQVHS